MAVEVLKWCTDEDLAIETPEFRVLCSGDQIDAYGTDGFFNIDTPWVLRSSIVDFFVNGIQSSQVIWLSQPEAIFGGDPGEAFAVDSVMDTDHHALTLRRKGRPLGVGDAPCDGVTPIMGVHFIILTLEPLIEKASRELDERYSISDLLETNVGKTISDVDMKILAELTICMVLERRYLAISRGTTIPGAKDVYFEKSAMYQQRRIDLEPRVALRFTTGEAVRRQRSFRRIYKW